MKIKFLKVFENSSLNPSKPNKRNEKYENLISKDNISHSFNNLYEIFPLPETSNILLYTAQAKKYIHHQL